MTAAQALARGARALRDAGVPDAPVDARHLLALALGLPPGRLALHLAEPVSEAALAAYDALLARRARREPLSHLAGRRAFWGRDFRVTRDVLDPRPETETLVRAALEAPFARVLDLGTGSGCLLLTLLAERPAATGLGLDLSPAALAVAWGNAARLGLGARAVFALSDWCRAAAGRFDLVVANPPYIPAAEIAALEPELRDWEPQLALAGGEDGLEAYRAILAGVGAHLAPGGRLLFEVGAGQAGAVAALGRAAGLGEAATRADLDGRARVVLFRAPAG